MTKPRNLSTSNSGAPCTAKKCRNYVSLVRSSNAEFTGVKTVKCRAKKQKAKNRTQEHNRLKKDYGRVVFYNLCDGAEERKIFVTPMLEAYASSMFTAIAQKSKKSILLVGSKGCGKSTVMEYVACCITACKCPAVYKAEKTAIYKVDINTISDRVDGFTSHLNDILAYAKLKNVKNVIVYFSNISKVYNTIKDQYESIIQDINLDDFNMFKFVFEYRDNGDVQENGAEEGDSFFDEHSVIIEVEPEEQFETTFNLMKYRIAELEYAHKVMFSDKVLRFSFMCCYGRYFEQSFDYSNYLSEVDAVLSIAQCAGRNFVIRDDVRHYYKESFDIMSKLPYSYNRATAIHETGHILLTLTIPKLCRLYGASMLYDAKTGTEALTCIKKTEYVAYNEDDEIQYVSMILAGRAAELKYCAPNRPRGLFVHKGIPVNRGSEDDIRFATKELRSWVLRSGAYRLVGYNIFNENYAGLSPKLKHRVDVIVKWLMKKAFKRAKQIINSNTPFMNQMYTFLLNNYVASPSDIQTIAEQYGVKF